MNWIFSPFFYVYIISTIISIYLAAFTFRRRFMPGAKLLSLLMICISIWSFFGALELSVQDASWKTTFSKFEYIGIVGIGPLWLIFVANLVGTKNKVIRFPNNLLLGIVPLVIFLLTFTNEFHHLVWVSFGSEISNWGALQTYNHGVAVYINLLYSYSFLLVGTIILFKNIFASGKYKKGQIISLIIGSLIPWVANIMYFLKLNPFPGVELTPLAFTITGILVTVSIFKYQLFELVPLAKSILFSTMDIGFVIIGKDNLIIEANPAAKSILGANLPIGTNIKTFLGSYPKEMIDSIDQNLLNKEVLLNNLSPHKWVELTLNQINHSENSEDRGKLMILHDISNRKQYEKSILESKMNLSVVIENTKDIVVYIDNNQNLLLYNTAYSKFMKNAYNIEVKPGISSINLLPLEDKEWWSNNNQKALNGERFTAEYQKQVGDEVIYFETSFSPIIVEGQLNGVSEFTRDITKHKKTGIELELKIKELERLNNLMIGRELKMIDLKKEIKEKEN